MKNKRQNALYSVIAAVIVLFCTIGVFVLYSNNSEGQLYRTGVIHPSEISYNIMPLEPTSFLGLKKFNSTDELRNFLLVAQARNSAVYSVMDRNFAMTTQSAGPIMGQAVPVPSEAMRLAPAYSNSAVVPSTAEGGTDYSTTNMQVSNVD